MTTDALLPRPHDGGTAPCADCPLHADQAVASHGPVPARLLFLSGAPRLHEEREGRAFASPAFAALEATLTEAGIDPATVHYATLIGCRPPHQRPIRAEEIAACHERLEIVIRALEPEVVVVCGGDAVSAVLPDLASPLAHGKMSERQGRRYYPIRHPYAALHSARYIAEVADDLRALAALLESGLPPLAPFSAPEFSPLPLAPGPTPGSPLPTIVASSAEKATLASSSIVVAPMHEAAAASPTMNGEEAPTLPGPAVPAESLAKDLVERSEDDEVSGDDEVVQLSLF